jgi:hypothetical protein
MQFFRHVTFVVIVEPLRCGLSLQEEVLGHQETENGITQELKSFIVLDLLLNLSLEPLVDC